MPVIQGQVTIAANAIVENVLSGSQFEYLPYNASLEFGLMGGAGGSDLRVDVFSGQDILCEQISLGAAARMPVYPDDYPLTDVAGGGERIKLRARNVGASPVILFYSVRITPF
jgi:hypothetical protein